MSRGRPFQPGNKFGRGRPRGSRNKTSLMAEKLFEDHSATLMGMALVRAREDSQILKMLVSRIPRRKALPIKIGSLPVDTIEDLNRATKLIWKKACSGKITWGDALEMGAVLEDRRHVLETQDIDQRLKVVESNQNCGTTDKNLQRTDIDHEPIDVIPADRDVARSAEAQLAGQDARFADVRAERGIKAEEG